MREERPYLFEEMQDFFGIETNADNQAIADKIVDRLQKTGNLPLLWIDRLNLMPNDFFGFAINSIRAIAGVSETFNLFDLYLGEDKIDKTTRTYRISMCEGSIGKTQPFLGQLWRRNFEIEQEHQIEMAFIYLSNYLTIAAFSQ